MKDPIRFIIITVLPNGVAQQFDRARRLVCEAGQSRAALAYPPHVTLRTGVRVPPEWVATFLEEFGETIGNLDPFPIMTEGILLTEYQDGKELKYLVGYRIRKEPALMSLNRRLLGYERWRTSNRLAFEPHLTLAFDDLSREGFQSVQRLIGRAQNALPDGFEWSCDNIGLYRRQGELWTLHREWRP